MLSAILPGRSIVEYIHDPFGRRIAKIVNDTTTEKYLWQGLTRLLAIYDGSDSLIMRFEYADGRMPLAMTRGGTTYYLTYDQVGSLRVVADSAGNVVKRIDYDSFGNIIDDTNLSFDKPFGFAGGLRDRDTGLVRFGFRDYDPDIGRWSAKDPIGFAGGDTDLYGYVLNDPINWIDPFGLIEFETIITIVNVVSIIDVLPIGIIPGVPQTVGEVVDIAAFAGTQGVLLADLANENITWSQFTVGSNLNAANAIIGTAGNWLSGTGNVLLSFVEGGILYLQYIVTEPCD